ncbi:MAG TPA: T9SS type A sorting domain-containing protein, partial [Bacteroidia bacterium]|nr:T9SS type A sorting domain-containing protein [Bacteroidia bacterium]
TTTTYITVNPPPPVPTIKQGNDTLTCTPAGYPFYQWFKSGVIIPGATTYQYIFPNVVSSKGIYKVTVSDSNGCSSSGSCVVSVLGINEISLNSYINVYPNPTDGNLQIVFDLPSSGDYEVTIANVLGQTIYTNKLHMAGQYTQNINLSGYSKGVYFLTVKGADTKGVKKIVLY